ncbi:MAG: hypothetical protein ACR2MG_20375 [Pyrinomonadaceae bacterium]
MKLNSLNINFEQLETVAGEAVKSLETSNRADAKRWQSAIKKAVAELESNPFWNYADGELVMMSETSNQLYTPNGKCGCRAFAENQPCRHRAAARLLTRYAEIH